MIDTDLAVGSKRSLAGSCNRSSGHQCAPTSSGLSKSEFSGGVNDDVDAFSINVEFLSGNEVPRCEPPVPFRSSHVAPDSAVVTEMNNRSTYFPEPISRPEFFMPIARPTDRPSEQAVVIGVDGIEAFARRQRRHPLPGRAPRCLQG